MNKYVSRKLRLSPDDERTDDGFTLVEILIAIVLIGILSAVVVVGISNLTSTGSKSACTASADAAKAASTVYYASNGNVYPPTLSAMVGPTYFPTTTIAAQQPIPAVLTLPAGITVAPAANVTSGGSWVMTMVPNANNQIAPTFTCS